MRFIKRHLKLPGLFSLLVTVTFPAIQVCAAVNAESTSVPKSDTPTLTFLDRTYRLGSHNHKANPMWEFVTDGETVENWMTLVTLIDRPDATTIEQVDQLSEGIMGGYKQGGAKVLLAKTLRDASGKPFNYLVVAFNEPEHKRVELNFVKVALGTKHAFTAIYGIRITDPKDYVTKAGNFLSENSVKIGQYIGEATWPELSSLPRREF